MPTSEKPSPMPARAPAATAPVRWQEAALVALSGLVVVVSVGLCARAPVWAIALGALVVVVTACVSMRWVKSAPVSNSESSASAIDELTARDLAEAVHDPLIVFDRGGIVLFANAAAATAFGKTPAGSSIEMKFRAPEMQELLRSALYGAGEKTGTDYTERVPLERSYKVTIASMEGGEGAFALAFREQSESRRIERMRADFIANASHELRTPLASVSGFIETLRGPARDDPKARDQFLDIMQAQTARMARLIDDLLSLSRLEMKTHLKEDETVDLVDVVRSVTAALANVARDAGVDIEIHLPPSSVTVAGNRDELIQVLENLIENACKYGASGGRVVVRLAADEVAGVKEVKVAVQDFGPGIAEEHIPRVTERFYRVDVETSRNQKGTGLGLAIAKHILTRHKARLSIQSQVGSGSTFTVHLPDISNSTG